MSRSTVLITGRSQGGIGDALAREFVDRDYYVIAAVRDRGRAAHLSTDDNIHVVRLDVTSPESINGLVAELQARLPEGKLDILINNAGVGATGPYVFVDSPFPSYLIQEP